MKYLLTILSLALVAPAAHAQLKSIDDLLAQIEAKTQVEKKAPYQHLSKEYQKLAEGKTPFVVFVGAPARKIAGVTTIREDKFHAYGGVVVVTPSGKGDGNVTTMRFNPDVDDDTLRAAVGLNKSATAEAIRIANNKGKTLVIYVGEEVRQNIGGVVAVRDDSYRDRGIWVFAPQTKGKHGPNLSYGDYFPAGTPTRDIQAWIGGGQSPLPFSNSSRRGEVRLPDVDDLFRSLRDANPDLYAKLNAMERYTTARYAQRPQSRVLTPPWWVYTPREQLLQKWIVPGGMEGVEGWANVLLRDKDNASQTWVGHADPSDGTSEMVHHRSYRKALFADVLFNGKGEVFEVRLAVKKDGKWTREEEWRDAKRAPSGAKRLATSECVACHNQAGTGAYDSAYVPGGDTVLSEPLKGFER